MAATTTTGALEFQCLSDVHLEFRDGKFDVPQRCAPHLALLGDIGLMDDRSALVPFIKRCLETFDHVWFVLGNHEGYGSSLGHATETMRKLQAEYAGRFFLLDCDAIDIEVAGGIVRVAGCTLWSNVKPEKKDEFGRSLNDFRCISDMTVDRYMDLHLDNLEWLHNEAKAAAEQGIPLVILTHHAPVGIGAIPDVPSIVYSCVELGIACTELIPSQFSRERYPTVSLWCFGHTHWNLDAMFGGIRVASNQVCYPTDPEKAKKFTGFFLCDPEKVFAVGVDGTTVPESEESYSKRLVVGAAK